MSKMRKAVSFVKGLETGWKSKSHQTKGNYQRGGRRMVPRQFPFSNAEDPFQVHEYENGLNFVTVSARVNNRRNNFIIGNG